MLNNVASTQIEKVAMLMTYQHIRMRQKLSMTEGYNI